MVALITNVFVSVSNDVIPEKRVCVHRRFRLL